MEGKQSYGEKTIFRLYHKFSTQLHLIVLTRQS